jgi:hypothetical protein
MGRATASALVVVTIGSTCAGCASAPPPSAYATATYHAAGVGVSTVRSTGADLYHGAGQAIRAPLHDLNMMQDQIPPVLLRAEAQPYDLAAVDSCNDVLNKVAELDLALGPDLDMPKQNHRTRAARGADFAASAALDAAGSAVEHFIPMRGTIKQISGATRYENHVKHAVLSGEVRRSFLKAVGMAHNCTWPAAPLAFHPTQVADINASWSGGAAVQYASATASAPGALRPAMLGGAPAGPVRVETASIALPRASAGAADPTQSWRPPAGSLKTAAAQPMRGAAGSMLAARYAQPTSRTAADGATVAGDAPGVVQVAAPLTGSAAAPWSAGFAGH